MSYFPLYIQLKDYPCLVVGGGPVAWHKVCVLQDFGADVSVIAPRVCREIRQMPRVIWHEKCYEETDLEEMRLVVAATSDKSLNHRIAEDCRKRGIPVNAVDQQEDCDFIFPSYVKQGEVVAAFSSGGQSPLVTQYLKRANEPLVTAFLGELAGCLGELRQEVKERIEPGEKRRQIYEEVLRLGLERGELPAREEIEKIMERK